MAKKRTAIVIDESQGERYAVIEGGKKGLAETQRIASAALQHALAVAVLTCYSRNMLGAAIRACVGG
jgi:hypothetical protein